MRAVELQWYQDASGATTLVPRIFGETERAATQKGAPRAKLGAMDAETWIGKNTIPRGNDSVRGAQMFMTILEQLGGRIEVAITQGSMYGAFRSQNGTLFYPLHLSRDNRFSLSFNYLLKRPGLSEEAARSAIYEIFNQAVGPLSTKNLQGYPGFLVSSLSSSDICKRFRDAAAQLIALASAD